MTGRNRKYKPPYGFTVCPKLRKLYEENGVAFGRFYLWYPEEALKAWSMLGGVLGPRWTLEVFRYHWIKDNPMDYWYWKKRRRMAKRRAKLRQQDSDKLDE